MRMTHLLAASSAALAIMACASSANAVSVTVLGDQPGNLEGTGAYSGFLYGHQIINDFDNAPNANYSYTVNDSSLSYVRDGSLGLDPGVSAPPPVPVDDNNPNGAYTYGDSNYWTVLGGGSFTVTALANPFRSFSFYFGSPDTFNDVQFTFEGGQSVVTLSGAALWDSMGGANGDQTWGRRVYYQFDENVTKITMKSSGNAFEFDGLATGAVPEPATWAMMIMGFGGVGAVIRRRRMVPALAA